MCQSSCYTLAMNRIEDIASRYNELRAQGHRGIKLYRLIQREFGDISPSSIRAYATGRRFKRASESNSPTKLIYVQLPRRVAEMAEITARKEGLSLNELIGALLMNYVLDHPTDPVVEKEDRRPVEPDKNIEPKLPEPQ